MNIFNSLGSNYNGRFVWLSIIMPGSRKSYRRLTKNLSELYGGQAILTYKGRQALELAFRNSGLPKGGHVGINGFTCYVVYQAVERAGYKPVMIDVAPKQLNFGLAELKKAQSRHKLQAVVIQNTLGLPADIVEIEKFCAKNKIMIIEDLAHSLGAQYADGREAGTVGDFTMLSFSQDKPLDVVAGGALIDRRKQAPAIQQPKARASLWQREKNALYPMWTAIIRATYPINLGRYIHFLLKKLKLMATPMSDNRQGLAKMEPSAVRLLLSCWWPKRNDEVSHRRKVAEIYKKNLPKSVLLQPIAKSNPTFHRFPIWVKNPAPLASYLKKRGVYIGDTWYDAPIGPKKYLAETDYHRGDCPEAEKLAEHIVNLPTHRHVNEKQAHLIAEGVKAWLQSM